ncbi:MAG: 30S ribosomal protein S20 [Oscillospiraceae bacterium]|jgi:small subunit ribosomal protein S20|nr:30S ribosomal protein S20 [Oscillospiraceae bacterium]
MPNIKSAKKRVKVISTKTLQNRMLKGKLRAALKAVDAAVAAGTADAALLQATYKTIDQSAAKGIIHKNQAARKKAQVAAKISAAKA